MTIRYICTVIRTLAVIALFLIPCPCLADTVEPAGAPARQPRKDCTHTYVFSNDRSIHRLDPDVPVGHTNLLLDVNMLGMENGDSLRIPLETVDSVVFRTVDVPWIRIDLPDNPDMEQLVEKDTYLNGLISLKGNGYVDDFGPWPMKIKGRGNSTWDAPKKPYRVKFDRKVAMGGFGKMKNYVFLANYYDGTAVKNELALWLGRRIGVRFPNHTLPCELWFNGRYKGLYQITEKIGISGASVDIDEETGMLFELSTEFDEPYQFRSAVYDLPVMVKDPDLEEICGDNPDLGTPEEYLSLWQVDWNRAESLVAEGRAFEAFDLDSFVDYFLLYNIVGNREIGWPKSLYVHKREIGEGCRYEFGPAWDFDICMNTKQVFDDVVVIKAPDLPMWLNPMFEVLVEYDEFRKAYRKKVEWFVEEVYPEMVAYLDSFTDLIEPAARLNGPLWPGHKNWVMVDDTRDLRDNVAEIKEWLALRIPFLLTEYFPKELPDQSVE